VPAQRYQLANHLGSACLELDEAGALISYEEYSPYGNTTYQAGQSAEVSLKRYRYTGMERDEESGLSYHSARYYASWLGRWTSCDPLVLDTKAFAPNHGRPLNLYWYCAGSPLNAVDRDGREVYILVDTNGRDIDYAAIQTRKYEIEHWPGFDPKKDNVYPVQVPDLGKLKDTVDVIRADAAKQGFGPTVEFSVWGHAGADGPAAAKDNSGPFAVDRKQMKIEGWNQIDFGWRKGDSFAAFFGCDAADFAEKFVAGQQSKGLSMAGYFDTTSYPSLSQTTYVRDQNGWGVDAIAEDIKRGNRSVSANLGVWYLGIQRWDHRVNTLTGSPVLVRQMKWARPQNWWVPPSSQPTTTPAPIAPSSGTVVPPQPVPKIPTGGVLI
jgi:RHS repeat-associated protein